MLNKDLAHIIQSTVTNWFIDCLIVYTFTSLVAFFHQVRVRDSVTLTFWAVWFFILSQSPSHVLQISDGEGRFTCYSYLLVRYRIDEQVCNNLYCLTSRSRCSLCHGHRPLSLVFCLPTNIRVVACTIQVWICGCNWSLKQPYWFESVTKIPRAPK